MDYTNDISHSWRITLASRGSRLSSDFFGAATGHEVVKIILNNFAPPGMEALMVHHTCNFEITPSARDVLHLSSGCAPICDL